MINTLGVKMHGVLPPKFEYDTENNIMANELIDKNDNKELSLDEIIGQDKAIKELRKFINSIKYNSVFKKWGIDSPKGILLTGSPGTGKTASVRALAKELTEDAILMELKYLDIASKWIDHPIERLKEFFSAAEKYAKDKHVIIFIDEIDAMLPKRDSMLHETSSKRVNVFLSWMDGGFSAIDNITIIGATNYEDGIDSAAKRPGRFDKIVKFEDLSADSILAGLKMHLKKRNIDVKQIKPIEWDRVLNLIPDKGLSGADLPEIISRVLLSKVTQHIDVLKKYTDYDLISPKERISIQSDSQYFPSPIVTEDILSIVEDYKVERTKDINNIGFI